MYGKLSRVISVGFDLTDQLLITYCGFVKYCRRNGVERDGAVSVYRLQVSVRFSHVGVSAERCHCVGCTHVLYLVALTSACLNETLVKSGYANISLMHFTVASKL
jgi:hypothetical protein